RAEVAELRMGSGVEPGVRGPAADETELVALAVADADLVDPYLVLQGDDGTGRRVQILLSRPDGIVEADRRGGDVHAPSGNLGIAEGDDGDVPGNQIRSCRWLSVRPARIEAPAETRDVRLVGVRELQRDVQGVRRPAVDGHARRCPLGRAEA